MIVRRIDTPIGGLWLGEENGRICLAAGERPESAEEGSSPLLVLAAEQLAEYFAGTRAAFDLPLAIGGSDFARRVYEELARVPFGETVSYKRLAVAAGSPKAARAVGSACGANPLLVLIPCHRVVCSDGSLGGYALGVDRKRWLIEHEMVIMNEKI